MALAISASAFADGLPAGKLEFYPSLNMQLGRNSNVFNRSDESQITLDPEEGPGDRYGIISAPLLWRLPFRASRWDFGYTPGVYLYDKRDGLNGYSHQIGSDLLLNFSNGSSLSIGGGYLFDSLNTTAYDPGEETRFNATPYELATMGVRFEQPVSLRYGYGFGVSRETINFENNTPFSFVDYRKFDATGSFFVFLPADSRLEVEAAYGNNWQDRQLYEVDEKRWTRQSLQIGYAKQFDERNMARFFIGYENLLFQESNDSDFTGFVGRFIYQRALTRSIRLQSEVIRRPSQSIFNVNNYYVTDRAAVRTFVRSGSRIFYVATLSYQRNSYPDESMEFCAATADQDSFIPIDEGCFLDPTTNEPILLGIPEDQIGFRRRDDLFRGSAGFGVQFARTSALQLTVEYTDRTSNIDSFEYDTTLVYLEFRFGWSPDREFI